MPQQGERAPPPGRVLSREQAAPQSLRSAGAGGVALPAPLAVVRTRVAHPGDAQHPVPSLAVYSVDLDVSTAARWPDPETRTRVAMALGQSVAAALDIGCAAAEAHPVVASYVRRWGWTYTLLLLSLMGTVGGLAGLGIAAGGAVASGVCAAVFVVSLPVVVWAFRLESAMLRAWYTAVQEHCHNVLSGVGLLVPSDTPTAQQLLQQQEQQALRNPPGSAADSRAGLLNPLLLRSRSASPSFPSSSSSACDSPFHAASSSNLLTSPSAA
jgi:hypothetical protein